MVRHLLTIIIAAALFVGVPYGTHAAVELDGDTNGATDISKGGTNGTTVSAARTSLGLAIGTDVQAYDANLDTVSTPTNWRFFYSNGTATLIELALGADGTFLMSNGASVAPTFETPAGSGDVTEAGDNTFTGTNIFNGSTQLNRLADIIFSDGTENMTSETFAFAANRALKILDYDSQIAADALLDDTTGLLATTAQVVNSITTRATPTTANPYTLTAANSYNASVYYGATGEIDLPAVADGMAVVVYNTGAFTITIDPNASEAIVRDGTLQTGGVSFTLSSGLGNFVCIVSDGVEWQTLGYKGTLAEGT